MSAYPSLLSPLMDATGLIATVSLNTTAQTALAAGTYASAEVDILKITALQESNNVYTGLVGASMLVDGDITCSTLNYTTLNPPIPAEVIPTLSQVITAGNDAGTQNIIGVQNFTCAGTVSANETIISGQASSASLLVKNSGSQDVVSSIDGAGLITADSYNINSGLANIQATGAINCVSINAVSPQFKPTYDYYVSKGGLDSGLGSVLSPYLTVQKAITECELQIDGVPRVIHVSCGSFTENLTFSKSRISVKGQGVGTHPDIGTSITGTITITITDGDSDLHNNNINLSGFLLVGTVEDNTTLDRPHRLSLSDCRMYANDRCLYIHPVFDYRCYVSECVISNDSLVSTDPLVQCAGLGMVSFTQNQMTAKGASQNVFKLSGTCRIDLFAQNVLTSDSIGTNVAVSIFNHNSTQTITLGQNAFVYGNSGAKRNAETASGVFLNNTGSLVLLSNTFSLSGLASSQMAVYSTSLSFPTTIIIYGANISTSNPLALTATGISGSQGTTKVASLSVQ